MKIIVKKSKLHERGVFAARYINKKEIIEVCDLILLEESELHHLNKTILGNYTFSWRNKYGALALGNGSLYNHSYEPNAKYIQEYKENKLKFVAIKDIKKGEEILVNYNGNPENKDKVWFDK